MWTQSRHEFSFYWHNDESIIQNVERIKNEIMESRISLLEAERSIPLLKEIIKRNKNRIKEVQELIAIYTKSCKELEDARPYIRKYRKEEKAIFLKNKDQYLKDKSYFNQLHINNYINDFINKEKAKSGNFHNEWFHKQIAEFRDKQSEIDEYVNCDDFDIIDFINKAYRTVNEAMEKEKEFMAPRIEQALRRYRATHGY